MRASGGRDLPHATLDHLHVPLRGKYFPPSCHAVQPKGTGTTAYAWFVWDKDAPGSTELKLVPGLF
jgi:hypothetical protein